MVPCQGPVPISVLLGILFFMNLLKTKFRATSKCRLKAH
jgi:hypothetical protein